ncbi:uncharacterized protein LOC143368881 isoform X2 [Andrena cerasifolii]
MDMIRANLVAGASVVDVGGNVGATEEVNADATTVPEELFRKYTDTDSRPLTPAPTLASGPALTSRPTQDEYPVTCNPRERTTLVLDLRANSKKQMENETFTWHALTLEPPPTPRKPGIFLAKSAPRHQPRSPKSARDVPASVPSAGADELSSSKDAEGCETERASKEPVIIRRRGKRLRKGKCRRGSAYGHQAEVRDLLEPTETQISHIGDGSRRTSIRTCNGDTENPSSPKKVSAQANVTPAMLTSFIQPDILKHLCRELDRDKVEAEFSIRRRIAFEEAFRVKGESYSRSRGTYASSNVTEADTPRVFSRQMARFQILDSESLRGLTVLEYLSRHVSVSSGRKLVFGRVFNKFQEETLRSTRCISPNNIQEALQEIIGKPMTEEQAGYLKFVVGEIKDPLNFRSWCCLCAAVERLLCPLPPKEVDPASWLERVDFEPLERRLKSVDVVPTLALFLREIREK